MGASLSRMTRRRLNPGEVLAHIQPVMGHTPRSSLVVVGITPAGTVGSMTRIDTSACRTQAMADAVAASVAGQLMATGSVAATVASFREDGWDCQAAPLLAARLSMRMEVTDTWVVFRGRYRSPECADLECCPPSGRPLPAGIRRSVRVSTPGATHGHVREIAPVAARRKAMRARIRALQTASEREQAVWRAGALTWWREAVSRADEGLPAEAAAGRLAAALDDVVIRDACVVDLVPGAAAVAEDLCRDPAAPGVRQALDAMIGRSHPATPDTERLLRVRAVADHVAWLSGNDAAAPLTLGGLCSWWAGDQEAATQRIQAALACDQDYRLAMLVKCAMDVGLEPGWKMFSSSGHSGANGMDGHKGAA